MPKSKNRKNHKQKVNSWKITRENNMKFKKKMFMKDIEQLKEYEKFKQASETNNAQVVEGLDVGDVSITSQSEQKTSPIPNVVEGLDLGNLSVI